MTAVQSQFTCDTQHTACPLKLHDEKRRLWRESRKTRNMRWAKCCFIALQQTARIATTLSEKDKIANDKFKVENM